MTAVRTNFPLETVNLVPQDFVDIDESESEEEELTPRERFRRLGREIDAWRQSQGFTEEYELTEEEVVAICKEARAELYAEKQRQKNSACR